MTEDQKSPGEIAFESALEAWDECDPAHRGAVLMDLFDKASGYSAGHSACDVPDVAAQLDRRAALSGAYQAAIGLLSAATGQPVRFVEEVPS